MDWFSSLALIINSLICSWQCSLIFDFWIIPAPLANVSILETVRFSCTLISAAHPFIIRSSGTWDIPILRMFVIDSRVISLPFKNTLPSIARILPVIMEISSLWPLPSTPAIPTISPLRTLRLTPESLGILNLSTYASFSTFRTSSPGVIFSLL